ncbi:MAG: hypothetical protein K2X93_23750 [Candidatus Obscuribacterales bacterium]|nr:hypothetical protein [Candidatus Obscuribacterales bacterium]
MSFTYGVMSVSQSLFSFTERLPEMLRWNQAIDQLNLPLTFSPNFDISFHTGGLTDMQWRGVNTDAEIWVRKFENASTSGFSDFVMQAGDRKIVINWIWSSDWRAACSIDAACVALVEAFDAKIFSDDGYQLTKENLLENIAELEREFK